MTLFANDLNQSLTLIASGLEYMKCNRFVSPKISK